MPSVDLSTLGPILILAPTGRDAVEIARVLDGMGLLARVVERLATLCDELRPDGCVGIAALFVAEEAFASGADALVACLARQPPWSDLPIVVLTAGGRRRGTGGRWTLFERLGNVTLLDRPVHAGTLQSAARAALRMRARQHEARQHLEALRFAAETLEARVEERTRELMAVEETLRQTQKMEAVGQLTGGIAHDFNNMLQGIGGSLDMMRRLLERGHVDRIGQYIAVAQAATSRAAALTHRLLAFSRRQTLDPRPTQANRLITSLEELIRRTVGPAIELETVLAAHLCPTLCDPNQLENALLNLCINARDAMPDGGRLTLETANTWVDERAARERDIAPGGYVAISVTDTGTGMTPDVMARAFDPFFTTKPLGQGTGLGLSMIYGFAKQSGGKVRIYSKVGQGTTVRIYLPRHDGDAEKEEAQPAQVPAQVPGTKIAGTVLVVDDEVAVRMLVTEVLKETGYAAIEAADGSSGLQILQSNVRIDLLISDVGLPGSMNGRQMADAARQARPKLKVLFITGYAENTVIGNGHLDPGMHVLTKPFAMDALASRVEAIITSK